MNPLFVLRRILLLLCLFGAQHVALAHAYEHHPAPGVHSVAGSEHGSGLHAVSCADCLSGHALNTAMPAKLPGLRHAGLDHVFITTAPVRSTACDLPEQRAHGPPLPSLI
ncbi:hypothetical protein [Methyloversatilis sp.]|uniref:hypothetical protein n=1 Tax=Methyloversatilis sp. TaxID=2569862 RepID=UPI0027332AC5|nr:hypothetical protein [Methyloversatilis sp.]MDP2870223.1 hypothetical protein [Methyloversatilis sp.]MDP3287844.1 hypothetical protein [Methyloversatilis sp.]MDP3456337.1 hypothetical protein [Methyloversatilis sp.]MDP3579471.1 hypothetical protein [Methyloversatilis sp.]